MKKIIIKTTFLMAIIMFAMISKNAVHAVKVCDYKGNKYLTGINIESTVKDVKGELLSSKEVLNELEINVETDLNSALLENLKISTSGDTVKTGDTLTYNNKVYTLVLKCDLNMDGKVSTGDLLSLKKYLLGIDFEVQYPGDTEKVSISYGSSSDKIEMECWKFLTETMKYSNEVAAGVMSNIKNESGFEATAENGTGYGILMWPSSEYPQIKGMNLSQQLNFSKGWIEKTFNSDAKNYKEGFSYSEFLKMKDPDEIAKAFEVVVLRPGNVSQKTYGKEFYEKYPRLSLYENIADISGDDNVKTNDLVALKKLLLSVD